MARREQNQLTSLQIVYAVAPVMLLVLLAAGFNGCTAARGGELPPQSTLDARAALALATASRGAAPRLPDAAPMPGVPAVTPVVAAPPTAGLHSHVCARCGALWSHGAESFGNVAAHTCPRCGAGPFWQPVPYMAAAPARGSAFLPRATFGGCPGGVCPGR